ncbi:VOC family protein [Ornithinicoccus halotolerans]|uniref:VOC family protein n=1 Tax=Ornithinicoccus halotolerans TaxID=1748220 RepID=UPI001297BCC0|nr:VOC family protein [Ornithinicoccus halotolerans]
MRLENIAVDCADPARLGRFWTAALGLDPGREADGEYEARLQVDGGPWLDPCFQRVPEPATAPPRLHLDLLGGPRQRQVVERLLELGARHHDVGQGQVPWVVLADPEDNAFCVMEDRPVYSGTGPIAALPLDSADPSRDARFYTALTGWSVSGEVSGYVMLRHPSGRGPVLELCPEPAPKRVKNRMHLDVRPEPGDPGTEQVVRQALDLGGTLVTDPWAHGHPWTVLTDPSGNEVCVLAKESAGS